MKIDSPTFQKIFSLELENFIDKNLLLSLSLTIHLGKLSSIKTFIEENKISIEVYYQYIQILSNNNILSGKDFLFAKKINSYNKPLAKNENIEDYINSIIDNLNEIKGTRLKVTDSRKKIISKWLSKGISLEDFYNVNLYFYFKWHQNPEMEQYIRPETLYNNKFESRIEESYEALSKIHKHKKPIENIYNSYIESFNKFLNNSIHNELSFEAQSKISFWLNKGISPEDIIYTINVTLEQWSKKKELINQITLLKILDEKFLIRLNISKKIIKNNTDKIVDWANS